MCTKIDDYKLLIRPIVQKGKALILASLISRMSAGNYSHNRLFEWEGICTQINMNCK